VSATVVPVLIALVWAIVILAVALPVAAGRADHVDHILRSEPPGGPA
jgi:hypothetical protein